jgi:hypothetical protein
VSGVLAAVWVRPLEPPRDKDLHELTDQFVSGIPEKDFSLGVDANDSTVLTRGDKRVRS